MADAFSFLKGEKLNSGNRLMTLPSPPVTEATIIQPCLLGGNPFKTHVCRANYPKPKASMSLLRPDPLLSLSETSIYLLAQIWTSPMV